MKNIENFSGSCRNPLEHFNLTLEKQTPERRSNEM